MAETKQRPEAARAGLLRQADLALKVLEVDLMPGSPQEAQNVNDPVHQKIIQLGTLIHGEKFNPQLVRNLFQELMLYPGV